MISTFHLFEGRNTNHRVLRERLLQLLHGASNRRGGCHRQDHVASIAVVSHTRISVVAGRSSPSRAARAGLANDPAPR